MTEDPAERVIAQGRAIARAIEVEDRRVEHWALNYLSAKVYTQLNDQQSV